MPVLPGGGGGREDTRYYVSNRDREAIPPTLVWGLVLLLSGGPEGGSRGRCYQTWSLNVF